ncbi:MAG: hypothetical protein HYR51_18140 [Candidatus Rokubacteria bacterium]|nr:hypothetical protein [Candidatus Rokubacteria bacterium]
MTGWLSRRRLLGLLAAAATAPTSRGGGFAPSGLFLRFRVLEPSAGGLTVEVSGHRHDGPRWRLDRTQESVVAQDWSGWIDLGARALHGRLARAGGVAEWPSVVLRVKDPAAATGCEIEIELADRPDASAVVLSARERAGGPAIGFLVPHPLRSHRDEFETGSQMAARRERWAREATGGGTTRPRLFELVTTMHPHHDPALAARYVEILRTLGFGMMHVAPAAALEAAGMKTFWKTRLYPPDPETAAARWRTYADETLPRLRARPEHAWNLDHTAYVGISDEVMTVELARVPAPRRDAWFREYLASRDASVRRHFPALDAVRFPAEDMVAPALPRDAPLDRRRLQYHAAKFGHWWSAQRLRQTSSLVKSTFPGMPTETLPSSHGFFNAWGPPRIGMSAPMLDLFELGAQEVVDTLAVEDWLGLNHMYGPRHTWTGAQSFAYLAAITRSAMVGRRMTLAALMTPSDDHYLRLKAHSVLGQGAKRLFFYMFGPTDVATENYWSDLRSEYDGVAKIVRALARTEDVLHPAVPVRDPVAVLYSVSHDIWHTAEPAAFVEMRLLWHALRHLGIQPDFVREEDVEAGRLRDYRLLFVTGHTLTRTAASGVDRWVRDGGVLSLSAGAATSDEYFEPHVPPFAAGVWPRDAARRLGRQPGRFNERVDLPTAPRLGTVRMEPFLGGASFPVLGCRSGVDAAGRGATLLGRFENGAPAAVGVHHDRGQVIAFGFMPMLAYGQMAGFRPTTLEERWPAEPRALVERALRTAGVKPVVRSSVPVVEASLLTGPAGSAIVLANYTYQPVRDLRLTVPLPHPVVRVASGAGAPVTWRLTADGVEVRVALDWADIVTLRPD